MSTSDSIIESIVKHDADLFEHVISTDEGKNEMRDNAVEHIRLMMEFASANVFLVFVRHNPEFNYHNLNLFDDLFKDGYGLNYRNCYIISRAKFSHLSTEEFMNEYMYNNVRVIVETLETLGLKPNSKLYRAASSMGVKFLDLLLERGVKIDWQMSIGYGFGHYGKQRAEWCLKHGMDPNLRVTRSIRVTATSSEYTRTAEPVIFAVTAQAIQIMVEHGADPNAVDSSGETVLDRVYRYGCPDLLIFLLRYGAKPRNEWTNEVVRMWIEGRHPEQLVRNETYSFLDSSTLIPVELSKLICQYFHL